MNFPHELITSPKFRVQRAMFGALASASVPIRWDELARLPGSDKYTLANLAARLRRMRKDPWQDMVEPTRQFLRAAVLRAVGVKRGAK